MISSIRNSSRADQFKILDPESAHSCHAAAGRAPNSILRLPCRYLAATGARGYFSSRSVNTTMQVVRTHNEHENLRDTNSPLRSSH